MSLDAFPVLLSRLDWPLRMVRLEAARQVAALLAADQDGSRRAAFLNWLYARETETEAAAGLLVVGLTGTPPVVSLDEVTNALRRPSLLSDLYLTILYGGPRAPRTWADATAGPFPPVFEPHTSFERRVREKAAPIFFSRFELLERRTGLPFLQQWAWEESVLNSRLKRYSPAPRYFTDVAHQGFLADADLAEGEVLRSALIRTLHFAMTHWGMPENQATSLAALAAPANLDLARLAPTARPGWWPSAHLETEPEHGADLQLPPLGDPGGSEVVAVARGPVTVSKQVWAEAEYALSLPATESGAGEVAFFTGPLLQLPRHVAPNDIAVTDTSAVASKNLAAQLVILSGGRWQTGLLCRGVWMPNPCLAPATIEIRVDMQQITYLCQGREIGRFIYWHAPWQPDHPPGSDGSIGCALLVSRDFAAGANGEQPVVPTGRGRFWRRSHGYDGWGEPVATGLVPHHS